MDDLNTSFAAENEKLNATLDEKTEGLAKRIEDDKAELEGKQTQEKVDREEL